MALLEEEGDEDLYNEVVLAAVDAAVALRLQQQHRHHPHPALIYAAPQKKRTITSVTENLKPPTPPPGPPTPTNHHSATTIRRDVAVVKAPNVASNGHQSFYREFRKDSKQPGFVNDGRGIRNWGASRGPDVKPTMGGATAVFSGDGRDGGGVGGDVKPNGVLLKNGSAAAWSGRRPLQEIKPWVGSHEMVERPSSTSVWLQAETTSCSPKENWFSGLSGVAKFKECQDSAMRTLVPSDYTMLQGKPFIKKTGWRKIAFFFNISFEIKDKNIQFDSQANVLRAEFVVRASMPSGRFTDSWGSCDRGEKRFSKPNHDIPSTAETRAKTRACQDLLGIGEYKLDDHH